MKTRTAILAFTTGGLALGVATGCNSQQEAQPLAHALSAADVFNVSAVEVARAAGYTLSSGVCEAESPERYASDNGMFGGHLFFHAFRVKSGRDRKESTVLFASNHSAAVGKGLVIPVNAAAAAVNGELPPGSQANPPISENMSGAQDVLRCAQFEAPAPSTFRSAGWDVEQWRREAIRRLGPEQQYKDGSKDDYVRLAVGLCRDGEQVMRQRLGDRYRGSIQEYVATTFCPHM